MNLWIASHIDYPITLGPSKVLVLTFALHLTTPSKDYEPLCKAVKSTFRWYERVEVCCVFLSDLKSGLSTRVMCEAMYGCRW
jgi:hypothetical protein